MDMTKLETMIAEAKEREENREAAIRSGLADDFYRHMQRVFGSEVPDLFEMTMEVRDPENIAARFTIDDAEHRLTQHSEDHDWRIGVDFERGDWVEYRRASFVAEPIWEEGQDAEAQATNFDRLLIALDQLRNPASADLPF